MASNHSDQSSSRSNSPNLAGEFSLEFRNNFVASDMSSNSSTVSDMDMEQATGGSVSPLKNNQEAVEGTSDGATGGTADGIEKLLQQQKQEIMYELRRMKLGDRPVTGQGSKEAVEGFFNRLHQDHTTGQSSEPSEQHRPEAVTVEVDALIERRPVSSLLQSARFRVNLETALRGAFTQLGARQSPVQSRAGSDVTRTTSSQSTRIPAAPPIPSNVREAVPQNVPRQVPEPVQASSLPNNDQQDVRPPIPQRFEQLIPDTPPRPLGPALARQWLAQQDPVDPNMSEEDRYIRLIEQNQQEEFIAEVSELIQRQLVSSSLSSNFRNTLEHLMENRMEGRANQENRARVQHFIRNLPRSGVVRNDFSNLGIHNNGMDGSDNLDDISVISATAAVTVPQVQNQAFSREMASVKTQLQELRNMMRLSFDLQLDIQRAIRQEVAAAVNNALSGSAAHASGSTSQPAASTCASSGSAHSRPISETQCLICIDSNVDSVLYQCGHMCVCYKCGIDLKSRAAHCPVCRAHIRDIIRAYRSNEE